jgi:hypothetical protein
MRDKSLITLVKKNEKMLTFRLTKLLKCGIILVYNETKG